MAASLLFGLALAFLYLGFAPRLLGNTLGKWLFSLQVVSQDGGSVESPNMFRRLLTMGIWPINGLLVLARRSRAHLGDSWAKTAVVLADGKRSLWVALPAALLIAVAAIQVGTFASRAAMLRAQVWTAAQAALAKEPGAKVPLLPDSYSIVGKVAMFHADTGLGMRRVLLVQNDEGWYATESQAVEQGGKQSEIIEGRGTVTVR